MKRILIALAAAGMLAGCGQQKPAAPAGGKKLADIYEAYWQEYLQLFPVEATGTGDNRYNDRLTITIAPSFRDSVGRFYKRYLALAEAADTVGLSSAERTSYNIFRYEMQMRIAGLQYPTHLLPINQFWSFSIDMVQLGSGTGNQPFKTAKDYDNWLRRLSVFPAWADTAIANMRAGIQKGWVLPRPLVEKILPQLHDVVAKDTASIFYGPIKSLPDSVAGEKARLSAAYLAAINDVVNPTYTKLYNFFKDEYLPKARATSGISALPGGAEYYQYCIRNWTTTELKPDSIYNLGLAEVARLEGEMNKVKEQVGFKGDMPAFFKYLGSDKRFYPFTSAKQVLDSFWNIKKHEDPQLARLFSNTPKTAFTIRQTEAFRAASASAEYSQGSADGTRPGIFYVPVIDPAKYSCVGMTTLFLHEAIPGHHYQVSLQQENKDLPQFQRFQWYGAYGEGWALYSETLGKELGVFDDPYQYFGHLGDAIHRAIRLVVDVGIHTRNMTREEAIKYMMAHEPVSEHEATAEIERYMALPGQALSYKIGQLAITAERRAYEQQLGAKFNIAGFHNEVLKDGCVPLQVLHDKLATWAGK